MAGKKDSQRFVFFKYIPPKKDTKPLKDEVYSKVSEPGQESKASAKWFGPPDHECPKQPDYPVCPEQPDPGKYPEYPEFPKMPEVPEYPEYPDGPGYGECPGEPEYPKEPECPEIPECPEVPELPEGPCPENSVMHVIQAGDTFWKLAKRYGTTVESIAAANPDADPLNLQIGETLCIPVGVPGAKG